MRRFLPILCLALLSFSAPGAAAADEPVPAVAMVGGTAKGREARLRFELRHAFPPEMVEAVKTGMEITFRYQARVERVRKGWFDETLAEAEGSRSVRYDALARVYRLQRDGREELLPDVRSAVEAMTRYELVLPLEDDVSPGERLRGYGKVRIDRVALSEAFRTILFFTRLWDVETGWSRGPLATP